MSLNIEALSFSETSVTIYQLTLRNTRKYANIKQPLILKLQFYWFTNFYTKRHEIFCTWNGY